MDTLRRTRAAAEYGLRESADEGEHLRWIAFFHMLRSYENALTRDPDGIAFHFDRLRRAARTLARRRGDPEPAPADAIAAVPGEADDVLARVLWNGLMPPPHEQIEANVAVR